MTEDVEQAKPWRERPRPPLFGLTSPNWIPGFLLFIVLVIVTETFAADAFASGGDREYRRVSRWVDVLVAISGSVASIIALTAICLYILRPVQRR